MRKKLVEAGFNPDPPEPDVLLRNISTDDHLVLECKAQGFSPASSTATQGRKLLAACSDPNAALGTSGAASVAYVLDSDDCNQQLETLQALSAEIRSYGIEPPPSGVLALSIDDKGLWAELVIPGLDESSSVAALCERVLAVEGEADELRPLYVIPYDPAAESSQAESERRYCAQQLAERLFNATVSIIGRADIPACVIVASDHLLREATFGVSDYWEVRDLKNFKSRIAKFISSYLNKSTLKGKVTLRGGINVEINLSDEDERQAAIGMLQRGSPRGLTENLLDTQLDVVAEGGPPEFS
ncbi:hypothetical protein [Amycolatopsis sp. lyj-23]|uniref:hypothetical protein n=1 Tax=Amycolatopsis sp. lyj-23 TaxID=2789283 RepID=UPI00397C5A87